tara:strand:+ start:44 stop:400 length:357 start_codon:yes stop_codon:yes gene_type:complete
MFDHKLKETIKQEPAATGLLSPSKLTKVLRHGGSATSNKSMKKSGDGQNKALNAIAGETRRSKTLFSVTKLTTEPDKVNNKGTETSIKDKDSALNQSRQSLNMKLPSPNLINNKKPKE